MSNRPSKPQQPQDKPSTGGGWHKPEVPGGWRAPAESAEPVTGWRVPALPTGMDVVPDREGEWHLPQPDDTTFTENDVSEIIGVVERPPDAIDPIDALSEAVKGVDQPAAPTPARASRSPEDLMSHALERTTTGDDDDDAFSVSELVALASLVEGKPKAPVTPAASAPSAAPVVPTPAVEEETAMDLSALSPAERALFKTEVMPAAVEPESETLDAAAYARQQLAKLEGEESATLGGLLEKAQPGALDPAEYARRQLEQLGAEPGDRTPLPHQTAPIAAVDPAMAELAKKFRDTETRVRALRAQFLSGQITRDDLQTQLKQLMILDNNQVWWMMGVETDTWYKFENNEWVAAEPPVAPAPKKGAPPTVTGTLEPGQVLQGSLPYIPAEQSQYAGQGPTEYDPNQYRYGSTGVPVGEDYMPLPKQVPMRDSEHTVVGRGGVYLDPYRPSDAPTLEGTQRISEPTVLAQPVQYGQQDVESPYAAEPPDYSLAEEAPTYEEIARKHRQSTVRTLALIAVAAFALVLVVGAGFVLFAVSWYNGIVNQFGPQIAAIPSWEPPFQTATILDARGDKIVELNSQEGGARKKVELKDVSPYLIHAIISVENERFYDDPGWDIIAISRAFLQNLSAGAVESGASTITQQIARAQVLGTTELSAERKMNEIVIAGEIAKRFPKNDILKIYLDSAFLGNQSYGVEAAAEFYFDKTAADLNMAESALLAGLIASPATYDPVINREAAFDRMNFVLSRMAEVGCLQFQHPPYEAQPFCVKRSDIFNADGNYTGQLAIEVAQVEAHDFTARESTVKFPHFVNVVQAQVDNIFGAGEMFRRGFVIKTTLAPDIQNAAQDALTRQLAGLVNTGVNTGAVMVTNAQTGAILAMVGSPDFNNTDIDGQVNNTLTWQQPGSSIKPVVYTAALQGVDRNGDGRLDFSEYYTPATILWDVPTSYPDGTPIRNFDGRFHGPTPMRYALGNSYNIPAVKTYAFIGNDKFKETAQSMGLDFLPDAVFGLPTGIGATEVRLYDMMEAYGTLANNGKYTRLYAIESITDSDGHAVELPAREAPQQVVQPQIAYLMQSVLSDDNARADAFGRNTVLTLPGYPTQDYVAAKTGTSNDARDLWTMGFTRDIVVGVWMGRPDNQPTLTNGSFTAVAPVWNQTMQVAVRGFQPQAFQNPGNVVLQQICADTGTLPGPNCANVRGELSLVSQPPPPADQAFVQTAAVDSWTGLRANQNCPDNQVTKTFANIGDPAAISWLNGTSEGQAYAQRVGLPLPLEVPPTGECPFGLQIPTARLVDPFDNKTVQGNISVTGQVAANPQEFDRYQLEYAPAQSPQNFQIIGAFSTQQQPNAGSVLGTWDTTQAPNGTYILRLAVFSKSGGYLYRTATINVNNPLPTQIPLPTPTIAAPVIFTPIPFDTLPAQGAPTPTIAVPGG